MNLCLDLYLTMAKVGVCTFGGGYAMLPILQRDVVEKKGWITQEELTDYYAVGQCTPGVIAINTATFTGYKVKGNLGGVIATLGMATPSLVIIALIAAFLSQFAHISWVIHAFAGVRACVCALVLSSVIKLFKGAVVDKTGLVIFAAVLILAAFVGLPSVLLVVLAGLVGLGVRQIRGWRQ
ncbi:MAG: chromate transporter [Oscillospiraceae bacterium]|nr:chromate transporter [Oscillospiraceae bacterium]